jgi:3-deoxy-D-manno-octulosonate 8-phosphate phosphatase (KDO 8-P phosphatase)
VNKLPRLVLTDIDGVWTDGGMYYDQHGNELKKFHTYDSAGVIFCRDNGILVGIITGENTAIVARRAQKLKVDFLHQGIKDKLEVADNLREELNLKWDEIAYIGDDINDIKLLQKVGLSGCPMNAPMYVKEVVNILVNVKGGEGVFRNFVEKILKDAGKMDETIAKYKLI